MSSLSESQSQFGPPDSSAAEAHPEFTDDTGELPIDTRRVLIQLLLGPSLDSRRQSILWTTLLRAEPIIRGRLHELFLDLVVDREHQIAFTRQVVAEELAVPLLLRRAQLTFLDSVLVLFLRQRLTQADTLGDRAVVSRDEMVEYLKIFERVGNRDQSTFAKRMLGSIDKMKKHNVLQKIGASDERFEVSPTLKLLFSAEEVQALASVYRTMAQTEMEHAREKE